MLRREAMMILIAGWAAGATGGGLPPAAGSVIAVPVPGVGAAASATGRVGCRGAVGA